MEKEQSNILLFDGVCNLCNGAVQFLIERDTESKIKFAALQSEFGQSFLKKFNLSIEDFNSVILIQGDHYFIKSTAALKVVKNVSGVWRHLYYLIYIPRFLRDFIYDLIAKSRYRIFGKRENCMIPSPEIENRFFK